MSRLKYPFADVLRCIFAVAMLSLCCAGCDAIFGGDETPTGAAGAGGVGDSCSLTSDCRSGLRCDSGSCQATGSQPEGGRCTISDECADGLYCSAVGVCATAGNTVEGGSCSTSADCSAGLYCELAGFSGSCAAPGTGDIGDDCVTAGDCVAGLGCLQIDPADTRTVCTPGVAAGGLVLVNPAVCDDPGVPEGGEFNVHFEVPRSGETPGEFYRLPFPNDIRARGGSIDMTGHPRPDLDVVGNVVKTLILQIEADTPAFGPHQAVYFRFNEFPDPSTISITGEDPVLYMVNISPDSSNYGRRTSLAWSATDGRGSFICHNWLAIRPLWSQPFEHGSTYAAIITDGVRGRNGEVPAQTDDFAAVLGGTEPADGDLGAAWEAYAPLRDYLTDQGIVASSLMGAAVFTIDDPDAAFEGVLPAVEASGVPAHGDLVRCSADATSPCDDGLDGDEHVRGCFTESDDYFEIHTTVEIPIFQVGDAPYFERDGGFLFNEEGIALQQGTQDVCTSIMIPKGASMPADGWPGVIYAHGTGGNFRGHIESLGQDLAALGYAAIGFDGVQHGTRRGDSDQPPDVLFFNFVNPRAAFGNVLQGAADVLAYGVFAAGFSVEPADSPTTGAIRFDPNTLVFFGHSQGATVGAVAAAANHNYAAIVLSGAGGGLLLSLLEKSEPIDIAGGISLVLQESTSEYHPVLNLIQMYFEGADPLNYARSVISHRPEEASTPSLFQTYGIGDSYTPDRTIEALSTAFGVHQLTPVISEYGRPTVDPPVSGNIAAGTATAAVGQYAPPEGRDGHFVIFDNQDARAQLLGFLESLAADAIPTIPAP